MAIELPPKTAPDERFPGKDSFVGYAFAAVLTSFPFLLWLIGIRESAVIVSFLVAHVEKALLWVLAGVVATAALAVLLKFASGERRPISADDFAKAFLLMYGLSPIGFAVFSLIGKPEDPCKNVLFMPAMGGCGMSISPFYVLCARIGTALLGLCMSGCLETSVILTKTGPQRWRLFRWSLLTWLLLAGGAIASSAGACAVVCGQAPTGGN
jgi:hypothetical protein